MRSLGNFGINVGCGGVGPPVGVQHEGVPDSAGFARGAVQRKGAACVMARDGVGAPWGDLTWNGDVWGDGAGRLQARINIVPKCNGTCAVRAEKG